jgi:hypothetical protein
MIKFEFHQVAEWPPLAWAAQCSDTTSVITVYHGPHVEVRQEWYCEAIWDNDYLAGDFDLTDLVFGSGARIRENKVVFVSSGSTLDRLQSFAYAGGAWISNSLPCLLTVTDAKLDSTYPSYYEDLGSIVKGLDKYKKDLKVSSGKVQLTYFNNLMWDGTSLAEAEKPSIVRDFSSFDKYYQFMQTALSRLTENASAGRLHKYDLIGTLSSGYDSPAIAVLAQPFGLREVVSLAKSRSGDPDDGREIAQQLGLKQHLVPREAWQKNPLPEVPFIAADAKGEDIYMSGAEALLKRKVLLTGHGLVWAKEALSLNPTIERKDRSGLSLTEYRLWADFIHLPVPFMAVRQIKDINAVSNAAEMAPWDVGGNYNKPICRRIVEEAGVPRKAFGTTKKAASVLLGAGVESLSPLSLKAYYNWLKDHSKDWTSAGKKPPVIPDSLSQQLRKYYQGMLRMVDRLSKFTPYSIQSRLYRLTKRLGKDKKAKSLRYTFPWTLEKAKEKYLAFHPVKKI